MEGQKIAQMLLALLLVFAAGCATVAPQQRAILADPTMQFDGDAKQSAPLRHAIENREGSMGGGRLGRRMRVQLRLGSCARRSGRRRIACMAVAAGAATLAASAQVVQLDTAHTSITRRRPGRT